MCTNSSNCKWHSVCSPVPVPAHCASVRCSLCCSMPQFPQAEVQHWLPVPRGRQGEPTLQGRNHCLAAGSSALCFSENQNSPILLWHQNPSVSFLFTAHDPWEEMQGAGGVRMVVCGRGGMEEYGGCGAVGLEGCRDI